MTRLIPFRWEAKLLAHHQPISSINSIYPLFCDLRKTRGLNGRYELIPWHNVLNTWKLSKLHLKLASRYFDSNASETPICFWDWWSQIPGRWAFNWSEDAQSKLESRHAGETTGYTGASIVDLIIFNSRMDFCWYLYPQSRLILWRISKLVQEEE